MSDNLVTIVALSGFAVLWFGAFTVFEKMHNRITAAVSGVVTGIAVLAVFSSNLDCPGLKCVGGLILMIIGAPLAFFVLAPASYLVASAIGYGYEKFKQPTN